MNNVKLTRVQLSNVLAREIASLAKPAVVARVAALQSEYAKRLGEPAPVAPKIRLLRYA